jgi:hypothetical protein
VIVLSATLKYIVPVFDYGQDSETDNYFIVMAKAEKNLREELVKQGVNIPFLVPFTSRQI